MAAHKYWKATTLSPLLGLGSPVELSEFQLYDGATRLDAAATLTANTAPTSGTLSTLKDNLTTSGALWSDGGSLVLLWTFPTAVDVNGVLLGARTTVANFQVCGVIVGSDNLDFSGRCTVRGFGGMKFVSAAKTPVLLLLSPEIDDGGVVETQTTYEGLGGRGLIADTVKTKATPSNIPTFCKVRLVRDIDGKVVREQWTNPVTGAYTFERFDETFTYTVIAIHPLGSSRAVIADRLTPGLMP